MNYLLVNLAVADIIYSAFLLPKVLLRHISTHPDGVTGKVLCTLLTDGNFVWVGAVSSILTLVAIATERLFARTETKEDLLRANLRYVVS